MKIKAVSTTAHTAGPYPLVFTVVPGDGTVSSLGLNGLAIGTN